MCKGPRAGGREQDEADMEENISAPRGRGAGWGGAQAGGPRAPSPFSHASFCAQSQEHDTVGVAGGIFWKASWLGRSQA